MVVHSTRESHPDASVPTAFGADGNLESLMLSDGHPAEVGRIHRRSFLAAPRGLGCSAQTSSNIPPPDDPDKPPCRAPPASGGSGGDRGGLFSGHRPFGIAPSLMSTAR
jgi:hypothetical protein